MHASIAALSRLNQFLCRASLWLAGAGLVAMTIIVFAQVFMRYVMNDSLLWVEPVAILLMSWFIFLGSAVGVHESFHMGFDVLLFFLPESAGTCRRVSTSPERDRRKPPSRCRGRGGSSGRAATH